MSRFPARHAVSRCAERLRRDCTGRPVRHLAFSRSASDGPAPTALPRHRARSGPRALSDLADPLLDAPYQTLVHCEAEDPLVSGEKLGSVRLICHSLRVSATLTEFRDAGWRIEDIHMTESKTPEGIITIPFSVSLRKLF